MDAVGTQSPTCGCLVINGSEKLQRQHSAGKQTPIYVCHPFNSSCNRHIPLVLSATAKLHSGWLHADTAAEAVMLQHSSVIFVSEHLLHR